MPKVKQPNSSNVRSILR